MPPLPPPFFDAWCVCMVSISGEQKIICAGTFIVPQTRGITLPGETGGTLMFDRREPQVSAAWA